MAISTINQNGLSAPLTLTSPTLTSPTVSGNLAFAAGTSGITFNNTGASVNSTLNDYEVGTYSVSDASGAGISLSANTGTYIKIGQMVYFWFDLNIPVTASGTQAQFSLPFNGAAGNGQGAQGGASVMYSSKGSFYAYIYGNNIRLYSTSNGASTPWSTISNSEFSASGFYKATF